MNQLVFAFNCFTSFCKCCGGQGASSSAPKRIRVTSVYQYKSTSKYAVKREGKQVFQARTYFQNSSQAFFLLAAVQVGGKQFKDQEKCKEIAARSLVLVDNAALCFPFVAKEIGRNYLLEGKSDSFVKDVVVNPSVFCCHMT